MLVVVGFLVVLGAVLGGFVMAGGALGVLNQPSEFVVIGGAALGSLLVSTPGRVLAATVGQLKSAFTGAEATRKDYVDLLSLLFQIFKVVQQSGAMGLEAHFEDPKKSTILSKYPRFLARHHAVDFLADSAKVMIMGGISSHDFSTLMDEDLHVHHETELRPAAALAKLGDALPGLGIVAAVLGIVITMGHVDGPASEIGHHVGAALIGTFLGILMSYGFIQPLSSNLEARVADEAFYCVCIKAGLLALYNGSAPAIAIEFARRVLPHHVRPSFEETEKFCRVATGRGEETTGVAA
jgi:chemotaxis protein MotA